jgi:hypothetical protein
MWCVNKALHENGWISKIILSVNFFFAHMEPFVYLDEGIEDDIERRVLAVSAYKA